MLQRVWFYIGNSFGKENEKCFFSEFVQNSKIAKFFNNYINNILPIFGQHIASTNNSIQY